MEVKNFSKYLYDPKINKRKLFHALKDESEINIIKKTINANSAHPSIKSFVYGSIFLKSVKELFKGQILYLHENVLKEFEWVSLSIDKYFLKIREFLYLKQEYEKYILFSDFSLARKKIKEIQENFGFSLWYIDCYFLIEELQFGTENNWIVKNKFQSENKEALFNVLIDFYSAKNELAFSYDRFVREFNTWEEYQKKHQYSTVVEKFINFKVFYPNIHHFEHKDLVTILMFDNSTSIIDKYESLIRLLIIYISEEIQPEDKERVYKIIQNIYEKTNDIRLQKILKIQNPNDFCISEFNLEIIKLENLHYKGEFEDCCQQGLDLLKRKEFPSFELIEIIAKAAIISQINLDELLDKNTIIEKILFDVYKVLLKDDFFKDSLENLSKYNHLFNSFSFGTQTFSFLCEIQNIHTQIKKEISKYMFSDIYLPDYAINFENNIKIYIESILNFDNDCKLRELFILFLNEDCSWQINEIEDIPKIIKDVFYLKNLFVMNKQDEIIDFVKDINNYFNESIVFIEEIGFYLYNSYLKKNDYVNALILYANLFFYNQNIIHRYNGNVLLNNVISDKFKDFRELKDNIELPIFFNIISNDIQYIYFAYDEFLGANEFSKPSDVASLKENYKIEKLIYFLREVCTIDVMFFSPEFEGTEEIENERIKVCQFLSDIDQANRIKYIEEISFITQQQIIRKAIRFVDESKIYVNIDILINSSKKHLNGNFNRYQKLLEHVKNNEYTSIDQVALLFDNEGDKSIKQIIIFSKNPPFKDFVKMFIDLRDNFISSNEYGLDAYLSTRIRHGTLQNHIRSIFERHYLITSKDEEGNYFINTYWNESIQGLTSNEEASLNNILSNFSKNIDDITKMLREEFIQIKTEKKIEKKDALFNYEFTETELLTIFKDRIVQITDFDLFIKAIISILWEKTEENLMIIRGKLKSQVLDMFYECIEETKKSLQVCINSNVNYSNLTNSLLHSKTEISNELKKISQWFRISENKTATDFDFKTVVDTSLQITKNIYPIICFNPNIEIELNNKLKGYTFNHFIDILRILIDNIIIHSGFTDEETLVEIKIWKSGELLNMVFTNEYIQNDNILVIESNLIKIKKYWEEFDGKDLELINTEGGSGLRKVCKILKYDLGCNNNTFDFVVSDKMIEILIEIEIKGLLA